ncbi:hypothetical protein MTAT_19160 [Moorella thermoacetica]|uniref:Uncharacterized protein n=1 Tax=Neomoorella thermoacetica TaxID=1525 RepID=A0AAC9HIX2_NEOTH|nr:hypothetical protein Maut_02143 [Moorella thermoacetica]TYL12674.1 hypothetical protein MTAT_19160 [Moorella thermoacetica]
MASCPLCGSNKFIAHQVCYLDVVVDDNNHWLNNLYESASASIYEAGTPFGPYVCLNCGQEYEELPK